MKHVKQSPCKRKTNFHKCCHPFPWLGVQSLFLLVKMSTWEAVRDRKFWTSHCSGMPLVLDRKRGSKPIVGPGYVPSVCHSFYDQNPGWPWHTFWPSSLGPARKSHHGLCPHSSEAPLPMPLLLHQHPTSLLDLFYCDICSIFLL